jgi:hypothetical protein
MPCYLFVLFMICKSSLKLPSAAQGTSAVDVSSSFTVVTIMLGVHICQNLSSYIHYICQLHPNRIVKTAHNQTAKA